MMHKQQGFSLLTIFFLAIGVVGGVVFFLAAPGISPQGQMNITVATQLVAQAQLIAQRIVKCATDYPGGDNGGLGHIAYPAGTAVAVAALTCPGNAQNLWSGSDGVYLPVQPNGFSAWEYSNGGQVTIAIVGNTSTASLAALNSAAARLGSAATLSGNTLTFKLVE